jgi:hypothetical protein
VGRLFMKKTRWIFGCVFLLWLAVVTVHAGGLRFPGPGDKAVQSINEETREAGMMVCRGEDVREIARSTQWGRPETLIDHFRRHGADFGAKSAKDYAKMAAHFFERAQEEKLPTKIASDGTIRVYDRKTNTFGAYNPDGTTKSFFKPKDGIKYWNRQ